MLIASTITALIVGVCFWIMGEMQKNTRIGLARISILKASEALDGQLRSDFAAMVGPNSTPGSSAGCLIIVPGVREGHIPTAHGKSTHKVRLRSDQLVFFANASQATGGSAASVFDSVLPPDRNDPALKARSDQARIWIGAVKADDSDEAQNWCLGRQAMLLGRLNAADGMRDLAFDSPLGDLTVRQGSDIATGSLAALADSACGVRTLPGGGKLRGVTQRSLGSAAGSDWTDTAAGTYLSNLLGAGIPDSKANYTNLPSAQAEIDLTGLRRSGTSAPPVPAGGLTMAELNKTVLQLASNCSEIIIQWAGDLDKDGIIDTYSVGHPLEGSMIWYPEENHASTAKDAVRNAVPSRYSATMAAKYDAIKAFPWAPPSTTLLSPQTFPAGFTGPSKTRFNGHGDQTPTWHRGFEFDFGEVDGTGGQTTAPDIHVPDPFIFRFEDDQYRLVNYGFRQDGGVYANTHDGKLTPFGGSRHWFPIPPITGPYNGNTCNPPMSALYRNVNPVAGPYPQAGATAASATANTNFGDVMGDQWWTQSEPFGLGPFRTNPIPGYPNGVLITVVANSWQRIPQAQPTADGNYMMLAVAVTTTDATGTETVLAPSTPYRSEPMVGFPQGRIIQIVPSDDPDFAAGTMSGGEFTNSTGAWFSIKLGGAAIGTETQINLLSYSHMPLNYGVGNNYTANYHDVVTPWLKAVNDVNQQGTLVDWRNPQSDWPRLIRIRVRLHDSQGLILSYSDEAQCNGRDDDGDGIVDNPEESRSAGMWMEYVFALPYPRDPSPRQH